MNKNKEVKRKKQNVSELANFRSADKVLIVYVLEGNGTPQRSFEQVGYIIHPDTKENKCPCGGTRDEKGRCTVEVIDLDTPSEWETRLDEICTGKSGNMTWAIDNTDIKSFIKNLLHTTREEGLKIYKGTEQDKIYQFAKQQNLTSLKEKIIKYDRFICGACESNVSSLSHTQSCQFRKDILKLIEEQNK